VFGFRSFISLPSFLDLMLLNAIYVINTQQYIATLLPKSYQICFMHFSIIAYIIIDVANRKNKNSFHRREGTERLGGVSVIFRSKTCYFKLRIVQQ
jgi:hypothetical protein